MTNQVTKHITLCAMIIAIIAAMTMIPNVGYISIGALSFVTIHVVVLLCCYAFTWIEGLTSGLAFGLLCLLKALVLPTSASDAQFVNPLLSVVPRVLFALIAILIFRFVRKIENNKKRNIVLAICCALLTVIHSALVCSLWLLVQNDSFTKLMTLVFTINLPVEIALAVIIVPLLSYAINKRSNKRKV